MIDTKSILWLISLFAFLALIFYIFSGKVKERLWKVGCVIAVTFVLFRYVADPLARVCEDEFLGKCHVHCQYDEQRYRVNRIVGVTIDANGADYKMDSASPRTVLTDAETDSVLIDESENCSRISLTTHDSTLIAQCSFYDSRQDAYYIVDDGTLKPVSQEEVDKYTQLWRGNIIIYTEKVGDDDFADKYARTDGKSLTLIQKLLIERKTLSYICLALIFIIALAFTAWLTKTNKKEKPENI